MNKSGRDTNKTPSIVNPPSQPQPPGNKDTGKGSIGDIPIHSKPVIPPTKEPKPSNKNTQPDQPIDEVINLEPLHGFGKRNKHNKPGFLRKGKKVAENFKFA